MILIVTDRRFEWEVRLERLDIPTREAWVPLLMLSLVISLDYITVAESLHVIAEKVDIIAFILSFAVLAEGLRRSGFFRFMAYQLTERCQGNTARLFIYLFLLSSIATYFTSNDIVILVITPIVVSVAVRARIPNARMLLLSQFVAANTVSMGLLIGSPTNLILGKAEGLNFFKYFVMMLIPTLVSLFGTLSLISILNRRVHALRGRDHLNLLQRRLAEWSFDPTYRTPRFTDNTVFSNAMRRWVRVLVISLILVVAATVAGLSLLFAAVPISVISLATLVREEKSANAPQPDATDSPLQVIGRTLRTLPFGVIFFGLSFFVLAAAIARTSFIATDVTDLLTNNAENHPLLSSFGSIFGSGALVNFLNDLPASALIGNIMSGAHFATPFGKTLMNTGFLIGLNIGTYVTPIGALAGIIWFDILRREKQSHEADPANDSFQIDVPRRSDLVLYGLGTFVVLGTTLSITTFTTISLADWLLGPANSASLLPSSPARVLLTFAGIIFIVTFTLIARSELRRNQVLMVHMVDIFVITNRIRFWIARHRLAWAATSSIFGLGCSAALLYWVESFHAETYHTERLFVGINDFFTWFLMILSSGFDADRLPRTIIGGILTAILALGSIAAIVFLIRASTLGRSDTVRNKIAKGQIPFNRLLIHNATDTQIDLVRSIAEIRGTHTRFVVVLGRSRDCALLQALIDEHLAEQAIFVPIDTASKSLVVDLALLSCQELILLSQSRSDDFANLAILKDLDAELARGAGGSSQNSRTDLSSSGIETSSQFDPLVIVQNHLREGRQLIETKLSARLRKRTKFLNPVAEFSRYLSSEIKPGLDGMNHYFRRDIGSDSTNLTVSGTLPMIGTISAPEGLASKLAQAHADAWSNHEENRIEALESSRFEQIIEQSLTELDEGSDDLRQRSMVETLIGVTLHGGMNLSFGDYLSSPSPASVGSLIELQNQAHATPQEGGTRGSGEAPHVIVLGQGDFTADSVIGLAEDSSLSITLIHPEDRRMMQPSTVPSNVSLIGCTREQDAIHALIDSLQPADRVVIFDERSEKGWSTELLLELLSIERLNSRGGEFAECKVLVECIGAARREFLSRFIVDEVVDGTWTTRSFLQTFTHAYLLPVDSEVGWMSDDARVEAASAAASALMHFDVRKASLVQLRLLGRPPVDAVGSTYRELIRASRLASEDQGVVIGGVRFTPVSSPDGPCLEMKAVSALSDELVQADDLVISIPHL